MKKFLLLFVFVFLGFTSKAQKITEFENFIRKNFPEYVQNFPNLDFKKFTTETFQEPILENFETMNSKEWKEYLKYEKDYLLYNNTKNIAVNIDTGGDIDQDVRLFTLANKRNYRINFCGSICRIEELKWIDNNTFIMVGNYEDMESEKRHFFPMIQVADLKKNIKTTFINKVNFSEKFYIGKMFKKRNADD